MVEQHPDGVDAGSFAKLYHSVNKDFLQVKDGYYDAHGTFKDDKRLFNVPYHKLRDLLETSTAVAAIWLPSPKGPHCAPALTVYPLDHPLVREYRQSAGREQPVARRCAPQTHSPALRRASRAAWARELLMRCDALSEGVHRSPYLTTTLSRSHLSCSAGGATLHPALERKLAQVVKGSPTCSVMAAQFPDAYKRMHKMALGYTELGFASFKELVRASQVVEFVKDGGSGMIYLCGNGAAAELPPLQPTYAAAAPPAYPTRQPAPQYSAAPPVQPQVRNNNKNLPQKHPLCSPRTPPLRRTAMKKLRIVILRFGTS